MPVPLLLSWGAFLKSAWSAWMLMGWLLSVLSAHAGAAARRPHRQASSMRSLALVGDWDIQAFDVGPEHHAIILHIAVHADTVGAAGALHHGHRVVGAGDVGGQVHLEVLGIDDQGRAAVLVRMGHLHVAVQIHQVAATGLHAVISLRI